MLIRPFFFLVEMENHAGPSKTLTNGQNNGEGDDKGIYTFLFIQSVFKNG